jgi:hypothetical protein
MIFRHSSGDMLPELSAGKPSHNPSKFSLSKNTTNFGIFRTLLTAWLWVRVNGSNILAQLPR